MKKVLIVGHCNNDGPLIKKVIESNFKSTVEDIKTIDKAIEILKKDKEYKLIIVNRCGFTDKKNGIELVDYVNDKKINIPIMLITNYEDKMKEAVEHGGIEGFGKRDIFAGNEKSLVILKKYL